MPTLDARLVQWMAIQAQQECWARLADGGADIDARIELASLFIDLPVSAPCRAAPGPEQTQWAMPPPRPPSRIVRIAELTNLRLFKETPSVDVPFPQPTGELHTLFDRPASLHNAVQWLKDLDGDVLREQRRTSRGADAPPGPREGIWRSVQHALQVLLGVTKIEVDEGGAVYVRHPQFDRVRFDALSDGYLTTAGWMIDMVARWVDRQQELDEPVGADVLRQMCGFVLIDEIDLHLHPMWQMRIIEDVRRLFPRLSFVVTTHNPLTLQGARPGEVYVMRRDGARIELTQRDIRPGQDVDRVLFEQFGV